MNILKLYFRGWRKFWNSTLAFRLHNGIKNLWMFLLMSGDCLIICSVTLTDWLMEWFDVTMSPSWSDVSVLPLYLLLFSFPTSQSERFMLNKGAREFLADTARWCDKEKYWSTPCHCRLFWSAICRKPLCTTKPPRVYKLLEAWFHPTSQSQLCEQFDCIHAILATIIISCPGLWPA